VFWTCISFRRVLPCVLLILLVSPLGPNSGEFPERYFSLGRISVWKSNLDDVEKYYGKPEIFPQSSESGAIRYGYLFPSRRSAIYFESSDLGGGSLVTGIIEVAERSLTENEKLKLPKPKESDGVPEFSGAFNLEMDKNTLKSMLGRPTEESAGTIVYRKEFQKVFDSKDPRLMKIRETFPEAKKYFLHQYIQFNFDSKGIFRIYFVMSEEI
jgi:hypothetical protein